MRIIGGRDYYDGVVGFDSDDRVFIRKNHHKLVDSDYIALTGNLLDIRPRLNINTPDRHGRGSSSWIWEGKEIQIETIMVIFCGKLYRGIKTTQGSTLTSNYQENYYWDEDVLIRWLLGMASSLVSLIHKQLDTISPL